VTRVKKIQIRVLSEAINSFFQSKNSIPIFQQKFEILSKFFTLPYHQKHKAEGDELIALSEKIAEISAGKAQRTFNDKETQQLLNN